MPLKFLHDVDINGHITPAADNAYDIGNTSSLDFRTLYIREIDIHNQRFRLDYSGTIARLQDHSSVGDGFQFLHLGTEILRLGNGSSTTATFAGDIISTDGTDTATLSETGLTLSRSNSYIQSNADNSDTLNIGQSSVRWGHVKVDGADFAVFNGGNERFKIDSSGNSTFKGDVRLPASGKLYTWTGHDLNYLKYDIWRASASVGMTIENISPQGEIYLKSGNALALTLDDSQNATFAGIVSVPTGKSFRLYNAAGTGWGEVGLDETANKIQFNRGIQPTGDLQSDQLLGTATKRWHTINAGAIVANGEIEGGTLDINGAADIAGALDVHGAHIRAHGGDFILEDNNSDNIHFRANSNSTEGVIRLNNGANWGLIARGKSNNPRLGAYHNGTLDIYGFGNSDGTDHADDDLLAQFNFAGEYFQVNGALDINGSANIAGNLDMVNHTLSANTVTADQLNLKDGGDFITFYGGDETNHSISSRDSAGSVSDDLRINSYGALYINLDSNNNNGSAADFVIGRHGSATGTIVQDLLSLSGETAKLTVSGEVEAASLDINGAADISGVLTIGTNTLTSSSGKIAFGGRVSGSTPTGTTDFTTKAYVDLQISNLVDSAPGTLDTLNELAAAINDDVNFSTTITNSIAAKLPLAGGTMSGDIALGGNDITGGGDIEVGEYLFRTGQGSNYHRFLASRQIFVVGNASSIDLNNGVSTFGATGGATTLQGSSLAFTGDANFAGNVGIGTAPASGVELHVNGEVRVDSTSGVATRQIRSSYFSSTQDISVMSGSSASVRLKNGNTDALVLNSAQKATFAGEVEAPSLDINGNADISGETSFKPKHYGYTDDPNSNTRTIFSTHSTNGSTSNRPVNWSTIYTLGGSGTNTLQISTNEDYSESGMWIRQYNGNSSSPQGTGYQNWAEVWTTNKLTETNKTNYDTAYTHSQSTHAPTDADATPSWVPSSNPNYLTGTETIVAPASITLSVVDDTINVTFAASTTSNIDNYLVFSSVDGGDYGLISIVPPEDMASSMSIIDNSFDVTGTQAYRIYAVKNGNYSSPRTGSISYSAGTVEPLNMSVVNLNKAYYIQWNAPSTKSRFVTAYNVYKHQHATQGSLDESSASLIYSGMNTNFMYAISGNSNDFHKFWVTTTIA